MNYRSLLLLFIHGLMVIIPYMSFAQGPVKLEKRTIHPGLVRHGKHTPVLTGQCNNSSNHRVQIGSPDFKHLTIDYIITGRLDKNTMNSDTYYSTGIVIKAINCYPTGNVTYSMDPCCDFTNFITMPVGGLKNYNDRCKIYITYTVTSPAGTEEKAISVYSDGSWDNDRDKEEKTVAVRTDAAKQIYDNPGLVSISITSAEVISWPAGANQGEFLNQIASLAYNGNCGAAVDKPANTANVQSTNKTGGSSGNSSSQNTSEGQSNSTKQSAPAEKSSQEKIDDLRRQQQQSQQTWQNVSDNAASAVSDQLWQDYEAQKQKKKQAQAEEELRSQERRAEEERRRIENNNRINNEINERLRKEKEEKAAHELIASNRTAVFTTFSDSEIPTSLSNVPENRLYYFAYICYKSEVDKWPPMNMHLTAIFAIDKNPDGSWPYKKTVVDELQKEIFGDVTLVGPFKDQAEAEKKYSAFNGQLPAASFNVQPLNYKGKLSEGGTTDFWGNPVKAPAEKKTPAKTNDDDFWKK